MYQAMTGQYITRSGQTTHTPKCLLENVYAALSEVNYQFFVRKVMMLKDCYWMYVFDENGFAFSKGDHIKPEEARKALREVINAIKINIWHPAHLDNLSKEEKK